jgi:hypothetical protein
MQADLRLRRCEAIMPRTLGMPNLVPVRGKLNPMGLTRVTRALYRLRPDGSFRGAPRDRPWPD